MLDDFPVLFACERLNRENIPADLFCYDVRHDDECQGIACEVKPKVIFTKVEKEQLLKLAASQKIPMAIEIDVDADTVSFHFREDEEELQDLCDVTFSRYISREQKYDGHYCRQALDNLMVSDMFDEHDRPIWEQQEEAYRHVIQKASGELMEQQAQGMQQIM